MSVLLNSYFWRRDIQVAGMPERRRRIKRHFFCPECVQDMQARPLYIIVTFWGMRTGRLLTVEAVSREFHITQRTAKNILYYIEHEGRNHIRSRRFIQNPGQFRSRTGCSVGTCCPRSKAVTQATDKISETTSVDGIEKTE